MSGGKTAVLYKELIEAIASGLYVPLGRIPSERTLMAKYNVSRETVRNALTMLRKDGLVHARPGCGTFVSAEGWKLPTIGVLVSGCRYTEIFRCIGNSICSLAKDSNLNVIFEDASHFGAEKALSLAMDFARRLVAAKVAGVIVQPLEFISDEQERNLELMAIFDEAGIPAVLLDCGIAGHDGRCAYDRIGIDNFAAGRLVGRHLAERGAKCVLCCASPFRPESVRDRFVGIRAACPNVLELEASPYDTKSLRHVFKEHPEVDAVVCQNDVYAIGVMASLRKMKRKIPSDVMVAGFDGLNLSKLCTPTLTTISQPVKDIAVYAIECLQRRMEGGAIAPAVINLPAPLVVQKTTVP